MIDYGPPDKGLYRALSSFDLVIVEANHHAPEALQGLKENGTIVIGYLSVMESPRWNRDRWNLLLPEDFMKVGGQSQYLEQWDAFIMDIRQPHFRSVLLNEAAELIHGKHCDGIFLDTVDDIDTFAFNAGLYDELVVSFGHWMAQCKEALPSSILIQNRGFGSISKSAPFLDGFLWEDWSGEWKSNPWMRKQMKKIQSLIDHGITVFTVSESALSQHRSEAENAGFVHLTRSESYHIRDWMK
ncbi:endo alpha-1,4 polygalactosaminidase [Cohnella candidum]|nr:endo alpha-1,4 polygalactosaminidase [Cohnella candidum]